MNITKRLMCLALLAVALIASSAFADQPADDLKKIGPTRGIAALLGLPEGGADHVVALAKASEFQETNYRDEPVVRSFDTRRWLRHPNGEYVAKKHLVAE